MTETNIDRLTMRAPIAGVILRNKVRLGQYAQCGPLSEPLMILGSVTPLHVRMDVDEHDAWRTGKNQWTMPLRSQTSTMVTFSDRLAFSTMDSNGLPLSTV